MDVFALFDLDLSQLHFSIGSHVDTQLNAVWNHHSVIITMSSKAQRNQEKVMLGVVEE